MASRQENPNKQKLSTPRGVLKFPKLNEPDHGSKDYPCQHKWGDYKTTLVLDRSKPGVAAFLAKLDKALEVAQELAEAAFAELPLKQRKAFEAKGIKGPVRVSPYAEVYDEETEEPTGMVEMKFSKRAGGERKSDGKEWTAKPDLFDAKLKPINPKKVPIWSGSVATVNFDLEPYFVTGTGDYGLSRRLNAVQIIELISAGGNRSASSYGFSEEEGFDGSEYDSEAGEDEGQDGDTEDGDAEDPNF